MAAVVARDADGENGNSKSIRVEYRAAEADSGDNGDGGHGGEEEKVERRDSQPREGNGDDVDTTLAETMKKSQKETERSRVEWRVSPCGSFSSCISFFTYSFPLALLKRGRDVARSLEEVPPLSASDIPVINPDDDTVEYQRRLNKELNKSPGGKPFWKAVLSVHFWGHSFFLVLAGTSRIVGALYLGRFVELLEASSSSSPAEQILSCCVLAGVVIVSSWITSFCHHSYYFFCWREAMRMRIATVGLIYDKALRLSIGSLGAMTSGNVFNLAAGDSNRLQFGLMFIPYLLYAPIEAIVILILLMREIGVAALAGWLTFTLVLVPLQIFFSRAFSRLQFAAANAADRRIKLTSEVVSGASCVKSQCWEPAFVSLIDKARRGELKHIQRIANFRGLNEGIFYSTTTLIGAIMFLSYTWTSANNPLHAKSVFVCLQLLLIMQLTVTKFWCLAVMSYSQAAVAMQRMGNFLSAEEVKITGTAFLQNARNEDSAARTVESKLPLDVNAVDDVAVKFSGLSAAWSADTRDSSTPPELVLRNVSLTAKRGELVILCGPVGSGKSSALMALLGELPPSDPSSLHVARDQSIAYCAQEPHIVSGTVEENILFGRAKDKKLFRRVVQACALDVDLKSMSNGERTIVGEKGVTVSGGQKARIALARAVYASADLVLLDDPLSAVDPHVASKLVNDVICAPKRLGGLLPSTVILVTHQIQFLDRADRIIVLDSSGRVAASGTYAQVKESGALAHVQAPNLQKNPIVDEKSINPSVDEQDYDKNSDSTTVLRRRSRSTSCDSRTSSTDSSYYVSSANKEQSERNDFKEEKERGNVTWKTYFTYISSIGGYTLIPLMAVMILGQGLVYFSSYLMVELAKKSVEQSLPGSDNITGSAPSPVASSNKVSKGMLSALDFDTLAMMLCVCAGLTLIISLLRGVWFFRQLLFGSQRMHSKMLRAMIRAPMYFFDRNPSGRILNRFSTDLAFCDDRLPACAFDFIAITFQVSGVLVLAAVANPLALICLIPLYFKFNAHRSFYMETAREVKRIEALSRSPIFGQLSETLNGLVTIRAFRGSGGQFVASSFKARFDEALNVNSSHYFAFLATARYFGFRLDFFNHAFAFVTVVIVLIVRLALPIQIAESMLDSSLVGLSVLYLMQSGDALQWCIRQSSEVENMMISVERIKQYIDLEPEAKLITEDPQMEKALVEKNWPDQGSLSLSNIAVKYGKHTETSKFALQGVSAEIRAGTKVALVGRTGAGKSSMFSALFRLVELSNGSIKIDGLDLGKMGLHAARGAMAQIPQSPWLFSGTIRENLDPFSQYSDGQIWACLKAVKMDSVFEKDGLSHILTEAGGNLSIGERQLVCLARALLSDKRIITLDEATANVDMATDRLIQDAVRTSFIGRTLIVIAHRLNTIIDSDLILVLDNGRLVEKGSPFELLNRDDSVFSAMCAETGEENEAHLRAAVEKAAQATASA